ncbi:MAG: YqgE/AlgH family protein [Burkholderiaceae bacterium]|nr:YqgE/AlgH family protein [Burkholderiaceae bacterium]
MNLTNHFLIAMPGIRDSLFAGSVVYVCQHHANAGPMGLIINKPADVNVAGLFRKLDLPLKRMELAEQPVLCGGPVQSDRGFVLHDPILVAGGAEDEFAYAAMLRVPGGLEMTSSRDVLEAISIGAGPRRVCIALGCASWARGQLEAEIGGNHWLTVPADFAVMFDTPLAQRYDRALALLGVQALALMPDAGHA